MSFRSQWLDTLQASKYCTVGTIAYVLVIPISDYCSIPPIQKRTGVPASYVPLGTVKTLFLPLPAPLK